MQNKTRFDTIQRIVVAPIVFSFNLFVRQQVNVVYEKMHMSCQTRT